MYLKAGLSVLLDLLLPICKSFQLMSFHPSMGYYGKKINLEPGRCKRTDGKKWRCSRDAHPDFKNCNRYMIRRRYWRASEGGGTRGRECGSGGGWGQLGRGRRKKEVERKTKVFRGKGDNAQTTPF
ncbi:hypothetical protein JHK82_024292 [Glycine max]|nr:hypothetical protein JHK85_024873 [Glycine max]KAG5133104.1 hypothetical protein JHK82_024292 [Glycine max]